MDILSKTLTITKNPMPQSNITTVMPVLKAIADTTREIVASVSYFNHFNTTASTAMPSGVRVFTDYMLSLEALSSRFELALASLLQRFEAAESESVEPQFAT